jgi:hypothetical protein
VTEESIRAYSNQTVAAMFFFEQIFDPFGTDSVGCWLLNILMIRVESSDGLARELYCAKAGHRGLEDLLTSLGKPDRSSVREKTHGSQPR